MQGNSDLILPRVEKNHFIVIRSIKSERNIAEMFTIEWYHAMFLMKSMIFMHSTPSTMINYVVIIAGKDRNPNKSFYKACNCQ